MIDYAVAMLKNPAHPDEPQKAYAFLQSRATLTIEEIADHMVSHGCNYDRGDIIAILIKLVSCSKELMLDGYRIELSTTSCSTYLSTRRPPARLLPPLSKRSCRA